MAQTDANGTSSSLEMLGMLEYPISLAPRGDVVDTYKSKDGKKVFKVPDPYRFLEDPDSKETKQWVEAENKITTNFMKKLSPMTMKLYEKMK